MIVATIFVIVMAIPGLALFYGDCLLKVHLRRFHRFGFVELDQVASQRSCRHQFFQRVQTLK